MEGAIFVFRIFYENDVHDIVTHASVFHVRLFRAECIEPLAVL
jgi:hypothetical protein